MPLCLRPSRGTCRRVVSAEPLSIEVPPTVHRSPLAVAADFVALTKPRLSLEVLFTAAGAMWLAGRSPDWKAWLFTLLGTALTVGSANTINCVIERDSDRFMARTARRPLPMQRLSVSSALWFAGVLAAISLPMLTLGVNPMTGLLGAVALFSYAFVYTPLKKKTHWAMQVGAIPGALPPLMGWVAATGKIEAPGVALFAIMFVWQLPHFIAIALYRKREYEAAGLTSLPLEKGDDVARWHAVAYCVALLPLSLAPYFLKVTGVVYLVAAVVLGVWFLAVAVQGWRRQLGAVWARKLFATSLVYVTVLFVALVVSAL